MARRQKQPKPGMTKRQRWRVVNWTMYTLTAVVAVAMLYSVVVLRTPRSTRQPAGQVDQQAAPAAQAAGASAPATCPVRTGEEWEYDIGTNCYFDPSPGHGHWHSGRPPEPADRAQRMTQPAPAPIQVQPVEVPSAP